MDGADKSLIDKVTDATQDAVGPVMAATKERAQAVGRRAQQAAISQLKVVTRDDIVRVEAQLDRIEAALNDLTSRIEAKPPARRRSTGNAKTQS